MLKVIKRRGRVNLYIRGSVRGSPIFESADTPNRKAAEDYAIKREKELLDRSVFGPASTATFATAVDNYIGAGGERRFLAPLVGHFKDTRLVNIKQAAVDLAARKLYPLASNATRVRQVYTPVSAILNLAAQSGLCPFIRLRRPRVQKKLRPAAEPEQLQAFLAHADTELAALAVFMAYTGRRISEACALYWDDVDLNRQTALIHKTKNREPFVVYLPGEVIVELANLKSRHGQVFGFPNRHHVYPSWKRACKSAKIPYLTPHEMGRHTFATWMRRYAGLDLKGLMEAGGWKSVASVIDYVKVKPSEVQEAAENLPKMGRIRASAVPKVAK